MKSQHRHELQTNELADRLGRYVQRVAPYSRQIGLALLVLAVMAAVVLFFWSRQSAQAAAGWSDYFRAIGERDPSSLAEVAREHRGRVAGMWAEHAAGDIHLAAGARQMFSDREEAEKSLRDAEKHYLAVEQSAGDAMLVTRARYGLAQVYETLGHIEKSQQYYEKVSAADRDSALGQAAQKRLERLKTEPIQRWYAWFERQEPPRPQGDTEPRVPEDLDLLPSRPDISLPGMTFPGPLGDLPDEQLPLEPPRTGTEPAEALEPPPAPSEAEGTEDGDPASSSP